MEHKWKLAAITIKQRQNNYSPFMDHNLFEMKELAELNEAMRHTVQGYPRPTGHSEVF